MNFFLYENPSDLFKNQWKIYRFPSIIGLSDVDFSKGKINRIDFDGIPNYKNLIKFLDKVKFNYFFIKFIFDKFIKLDK